MVPAFLVSRFAEGSVAWPVPWRAAFSQSRHGRSFLTGLDRFRDQAFQAIHGPADGREEPSIKEERMAP